MLIPLGFFGTGSSPAMELISTAYGNGGSGVITFSSIPSTYKHLQLRWVAVLAANNNSSPYLQFNGVATASYSRHAMVGTGSTAYSTYNASQNWIMLSGDQAGLGTNPTAGITDILDYVSSTNNKTVRNFASQALNSTSSKEVNLTSGGFFSTSPISSITFNSGGGTFTTATRVSLYGIKG